MRATIKFDTDLEQVESTMAVIACSEEHNLRAAADILSNYTVLDGSLLTAVTEVLRLLDTTSTQLRQYQDMLLGFERARFETILPQSVETPAFDLEPPEPAPGTIIDSPRSLHDVLESMEAFDGFVERMSPTEEGEEGEDDEEG